MAAAYITLKGISKSGTTLLQLEPHWWRVPDLGSNVKLNWVTTNSTGSYEDDVAVVSVADALQLHAQFKAALLDLISYNAECMESEKSNRDQHASVRLAQYTEYVALLRSNLEDLESALGRDSEKYSHFRICVSEWESGL